jgi:NAD(P)-dependent dehydrogenase (short-subunit alcohol dehydrogenase family)
MTERGIGAARRPETRPPPVAVVTGASRGLGAGLARAFAGRGIRLGLCARTRPPTPSGADAYTATVDVTDAAAVEEFARSVVDRFGPIDVWINNAGVLAPIGPLATADPGAVHANLDTNVLGVLHGSATFARHVRSRPGSGLLVNLSSGAATKPYEGWAVYCASKAAVDMVTEVVAREERQAGLVAVALAPGVVDTDMQALIRSTPAERFPSVDRFRRLPDEDGFNDAPWVADRILELLADLPLDPAAAGDGISVRRRVPAQRG